MPEEVEPPLWGILKAKLQAFGKSLVRVLLSPGAAVILILVAVLLSLLGFKNVQVGGLLGKLFGKKDPDASVTDVANSVPEGRVDENGNLIPKGTADSRGHTQATVVPIKKPGLFSNPNTVKFRPPGSDSDVEVSLPVGVKAKDVDKVIVVKPGEFVVSVKSDSSVSAREVDDLLGKYGG